MLSVWTTLKFCNIGKCYDSDLLFWYDGIGEWYPGVCDIFWVLMETAGTLGEWGICNIQVKKTNISNISTCSDYTF